jgi:hypothetical protein
MERDPVSETSCFSSNYLESGRWTESENPVILCVIHHRQNPIESNQSVGLSNADAIHVTGRGDPQGCETSRFPHFLDNRLTDGGEVSLTRQPSAFYPQEDSWYSFLLETESTPGL